MPYRPYNKPRYRPASRHWPIWTVVLLALALGTLLFAWNRADAPGNSDQADVVEEPEPPAYVAPDLQPVIDAWLADQPYDYNILIKDRQAGTIIASHNPDKIDLGASLYKIFAAYLAFQDFQNGVRSPDALLTGGRSWLECIDPMLRISDNPCGETMVIQMGVRSLHERLTALGMPNTTFSYTHTTVADTLKALELLYDGEGIDADYHALALDALLDQPAEYRRGLPAGAPEGTWYAKSGWRVGQLYNDAGLLKLPDGREFAVVIMGPESYAPDAVADFGATVYAAITR